jgi:transposase|tara:strand:+ start:76 stop:1470 length:1395 start_codon:yes stop_codon:yes gene_type:complete
MGKRGQEKQDGLFVATSALVKSPGHPFYEKLNEVLSAEGFDAFAEAQCAPYYAEKLGRPSIPPGVYFRMLMIGYYEGLDSERGIDWRVSDSLSLRGFLGYGLDEQTPDHSSLSRTRHRLPLEVHAEVFTWVLKVLGKADLVKGKTVGVDATTLEANAAMRSIVRQDTGETYQAFLEHLAKASGIDTPTREDLAKLDKKRPKKASNKDWEHPHDPDAKITKMKDGRTHLAHKVEHAVDLETDAILAVTLSGADEGDTESLPWTLLRAEVDLERVALDEQAQKHLHDKPLSEVVADKGYHSNDSLVDLKESKNRSYISEPDRGRRKWDGKREAQAAVYANRRRIKGNRGQALRRARAEKVERSFAHAYETGGMRRLHLRDRGNILKRLLIHDAACNLGLLMRKVVGVGTPRGLQGLRSGLHVIFTAIKARLMQLSRPWRPFHLSLSTFTFAGSLHCGLQVKALDTH